MVVVTASGLTGRYGHQHTVDGRLKQRAIRGDLNNRSAVFRVIPVYILEMPTNNPCTIIGVNTRSENTLWNKLFINIENALVVTLRFFGGQTCHKLVKLISKTKIKLKTAEPQFPSNLFKSQAVGDTVTLRYNTPRYNVDRL